MDARALTARASHKPRSQGTGVLVLTEVSI